MYLNENLERMQAIGTRKISVLLVDDDEISCIILTKLFKTAKFGFDVHCSYDGESGWKVFNERHFDICLLDINMPGLDGFELSKKIRTVNEDIPVIFLSSSIDPRDRLTGFRSGGDDFVSKPCNIEELVLRMNIHLRRSRSQHMMGQTVYKIGSYILDLERLTLTKNGRSIHPSTLEIKVLLLLIKNEGKIVSRKKIMKEVWGKDGIFNGRSLDVYISKLRNYFRDDPQIIINTIRNEGYRLKIINNFE